MGPPPVELPEWNPPEQAAAAMTLYDQDDNGQIDASEMSPGLKAALDGIDSDQNGSISQQELVDRIQAFADTQVGLVGVQGTAGYSGRKLTGATITFVPEPYLTGVIVPATGTVDSDGYYNLSAEGQEIDAVQPGIYSVQISKPDSAGKETLPKRFNSETELGVEVGREESEQNRGSGQFDWNL